MTGFLPLFRSWLRRGLFLALSLLPGGAALQAGPLPVFRCALESWPPRDYQVIVFHRGALSLEDQNLVTALKEAPERWGGNIATSTADLAESMDEPTMALWNAQTNAEPPWMVVMAPAKADSSELVWAGRFHLEAVKLVLDSPARKKTLEALFRGDAAVWILLECGDAMRDEAAVDTLAGTLKQLEAKLRLPAAMTSAPPAKAQAPLRIAFSLVRVTRNDPAEEFFVNLLSMGERFSSSKPAAFPVFGRGRALSPISGRHLEDEFIFDACAYITGTCSNGVKELKPGKDLLLCGKWDSIFEAAGLSPASSAATNPPVTGAKSPEIGASPSIEEAVGQKPTDNAALATAVMIGVAALGALILWRVRRRS